jgi:hypothetical protein
VNTPSVHLFCCYTYMLSSCRRCMNWHFWAPSQTALAMPDCPLETRLLFLSILMISSICLYLYRHCLLKLFIFLASIATYIVLFFILQNIYQIFSPVYIHLNILCIAVTGIKILCLMPYIYIFNQEPGPQSCSGGGKETKS